MADLSTSAPDDSVSVAASPAPTADDRLRRLLTVVFTATGFSALTLQVTWQRVISLHSGVDLASTTIVVAAFLGGLGLGSLLGGAVADRFGPRRSLRLFAAANVVIGLFSAVSIWLFYDLYQRVAPGLDHPAEAFAFNTAVVVVPTTLMGLSLPLLTRGLVDRLADAGPLVGRLYARNTIGAAAGAAVTGWLLVGNLGFVAVTLLAGAINLTVGVVVGAVVARRGLDDDTAPAPTPAAAPATNATAASTDPSSDQRAMWPWMVAYAGTGAVALGLEQVFFRLVDSVMRSNSYSFAHVLSLYLVLFGIGAALGSRLVRRGIDPARWFLLLQAASAIGALAGVVVLTRILPAIGLAGPLRDYFGTDGFNVGFGQLDSARGIAGFVFAYIAVPLLLMAVPVICVGAAFPCIQSVVSDRFESLGARTGRLLFANIAGNVVGTLLTGFVLIDVFGTSGTLRLLAGALLVGLGIAGLLRARGQRETTATPTPRPASAVRVLGIATVAAVLLVVATPSDGRLWAFLHGVDEDDLLLEEQRSCAVALKRDDAGNDILHINASSQNGYPFDDYHVLIGLVPALAHPAPRQALAIGMGIGATAYGMATEPGMERVEVVELCGGQYPLLRRLAEERPAPELTRLFADPRVDTVVGDGRKHLLTVDATYDVITVDTLRPQSGFSGSLYSVEFYELVADRLAEGGLLAQWVPTNRVLNSAAQVFPYIVTLDVAAYGGSRFMLASLEPIEFEPARLLERFAATDPDLYSPGQLESLRAFLGQSVASCAANGTVLTDVPRALQNRDLAPQDEYFLNNPLDTPSLASCR